MTVTPQAAQSVPGLLSPHLDDLGVTMHDGIGTLRLWSSNANAIELQIFDPDDHDWVIESVPLEPAGRGVWTVRTPTLRPGAVYALRADGPHAPGNIFDRSRALLDPYARGVVSTGFEHWRSVVVDESFDWGGVAKPGTPMDRTVIYEGHLKGLSKRNPRIPAQLHGTYAGLAHPATIEHLLDLGVTAVELLPIHAFVSEPRLLEHGLTNYWGYNTLSFFSPHAPFATRDSRRHGPAAVLREVKGMVKLLHQAGIEVILDVVYNHTCEQGVTGPRTSLRGLDNRSYYRQQRDGDYIDVTGCGNSLDTATDAASRLVLDSLRYWASEVQIDGFRFDLATTLGRDAQHEFDPQHPLLRAIIDDPALSDVKKIAEPWDVGMGGWQTGNFGDGWAEWNDRYRDRVRNFWLSDIEYTRHHSVAPVGVGGFATRLAGSANTFTAERGPLASVNFVTAHDGFTLHDLVSYNVKHNTANGEDNRDGADMNRSFNHGVEGRTEDGLVLAERRKAMRNLMGTLLLSAGVPMITAGDEFGRSQGGNNNAYCQDSPLTWLAWEHEPWQRDLFAHARRLTQLRRENPALRPRRFASAKHRTPSASVMDWYDQHGETMSGEQWADPEHRTLQYVAASTPEHEAFNRILLLVHGDERPIDVTLPDIEGVRSYALLWSSADEAPAPQETHFPPGAVVPLIGTTMMLFRADA
ncbi:glycogen debranching protein GlgX [Microbacterium sediminicola]|uniref:Glycogen debranching protein GlgX n=1 Tax=Microbacterium sediminicola TaxID=415210 RepID=A0ABN2HQI3_9MICO